jgi:hypothetical protein
MAARDCDVLTTLLIDVLHSCSNPELFKHIRCSCADVGSFDGLGSAGERVNRSFLRQFAQKDVVV